MNKTYIVHHGIKGQRWGIRRYQNDDGTLTSEGVSRYGSAENMERVQSRNKKILIGVGATAAVVGAAYVIGKNRKLKKQVDELKTKDALKFKKMQDARKAAVQARQIQKAADILAGKIPPKKFKLPAGAKVTVETKNLKNNPVLKEFFDIIGGSVTMSGKIVGGK